MKAILFPIARPVDLRLSGKGKAYICEYYRQIDNGGFNGMLPGRVLELAAKQNLSSEGQMTDFEVTIVETQLKVLLPGHYRRFLLAYPRQLVDAKMDLGWVQEAPADRKLCNNAERLVELNRSVRLPGAPWVGEAGDPWPDGYFVIGDDQCGNYWCVDVLSADPGVWFYDHEIGAFERQHGSLYDFGESLLKDISWFNQRKAKGTP